MVSTLNQAMTHDKHYSKAWIFTISWRILFSYVHVDIYIDRKWKNLHAFAKRRKNRYRKLKMMLQTIKEQLSQEHTFHEYICFLVLIIEHLISECTFRGPKKTLQSTMHTVISIQAYRTQVCRWWWWEGNHKLCRQLCRQKFHNWKKEN